MDYLINYLLFSACFGPLLWVWLHRLGKIEFYSEALEKSYDERSLWVGRVIWPLLLELFFILLATSLLWPLLIYGQLRPQDRSSSKEGQPFKPMPEDLLDEWSIAGIEEREVITDELGAVPDKPFGFLHPLWVSLKNQMIDGDILYSFDAEYETSSDVRQRYTGYVILHENGELGQWLATDSEAILSEEDTNAQLE